jgi:hypothetical protein
MAFHVSAFLYLWHLSDEYQRTNAAYETVERILLAHADRLSRLQNQVADIQPDRKACNCDLP